MSEAIPQHTEADLHRLMNERLLELRSRHAGNSEAILKAWLDCCASDERLTDCSSTYRRIRRTAILLDILSDDCPNRRTCLGYRLSGKRTQVPETLARGVPLHRRGRPCSPTRNGAIALDNLRRLKVSDKVAVLGAQIPHDTLTAYCHFRSLREAAIWRRESLPKNSAALPGMAAEEIKAWCLEQALDFHQNVKQLSRVKRVARPVFFGPAREFNIVDNCGKILSRAKAGGVWVSHVGKATSKGLHPVTIVFQHANRKRKYERTVMVDDDLSVASFRGPRPAPRTTPAYIPAYKAFFKALSPEFGAASLAASLGLDSVIEGLGYGRSYFYPKKESWAWSDGLWVDDLHPADGTVSICHETAIGCECVRVPIGQIIGGLHVTIEHFTGSFWRCRLDDGRVFFLFLERGDFAFSESFTDLCGKRRQAA